MCAGNHAYSSRLRRNDGADREAATESFGKTHDVGRYATPLVCEQLTGMPDTRLYLVEQQQDSKLIGDRP